MTKLDQLQFSAYNYPSSILFWWHPGLSPGLLALAPFGRFNVSGSLLCNQVASPKSKVLLVQLQWGFSDVDHVWSSFLKVYNAATFVASPHLVLEEAFGLF